MTAGIVNLNAKLPSVEQSYTEKEAVTRQSNNRRVLLAIIGVLSLVIVVAIITIVAVYFGVIFHKESVKKFHKEKQSADGQIYSQDYEVSSDELTVAYTDGIAMFDRKRGFLLYKEKNGSSPCYVAPYNITDLPDAKAIEQALTKTDPQATEINQLIDYRIHPTGVPVADRHTINPGAEKVCAGSDIEWAYLTKVSERHLLKRRAKPPEIDVKITEKGCTITCRFEVGEVEVKISVEIPWSVFKKK